MRNQKLSAALRASALGLTLLAFTAAPALAQSNNNGAAGANTNATANREERRDDRRDDRREYRGDRDQDRDWGWIGLLGLGGLLGLMPRKRVPVVHESRDVPGRDPRDVRDRDPRDRR